MMMALGIENDIEGLRYARIVSPRTPTTTASISATCS